MHGQAQLLLEMQTCTSAVCPKLWLRKNWNSCFPNMDVLLLPAFLLTKSLVSRNLLCSVFLSLQNIEHKKVYVGQKIQFSAGIVHKYAWIKITPGLQSGKAESFSPWSCIFEACFMPCNKFIVAVISSTE